MLEHGALVDETDDDSMTPLHIAREERERDVVRVLLDYGAVDVFSISLWLQSESSSSLEVIA